jgi:hypothetical protein
VGCLRTAAVVALIVVAVGAGWLLRDRFGQLFGDEPRSEAAAAPVWEPVTPEGAERARTHIARLANGPGPSYIAVGPGDLTAYIVQELSQQLPPSAEESVAAVIGDRLHVRASIRLSDFGGDATLGPLGGVVGDREEVQFSGSLVYLRPGLAEYRVRSLRIRDLNVPAPIIPRLLRNISGGRPPEVADDALPLAIPGHIGDIRVAAGRILVYGMSP